MRQRKAEEEQEAEKQPAYQEEAEEDFFLDQEMPSNDDCA